MRKITTLLGLCVLALVLLVGQETQAQEAPWQATYWNNRFLAGEPVLQRQEATLSNDWGTGSPHPLVNADDFSARWIRNIQLPAGNYRFSATTDDGMRVWVDDTLLIDSWETSAARRLSADIFLLGGDHQVRVDYYEAGGVAVAQLDRVLLSGFEGEWLTRYYDNPNLAGNPVVTQHEPQINFSLLGPPVAGVDRDDFSISWNRDLRLEPGRYRFAVTADDGVRLWINETLVLDEWHDQAATTYTVEVNVTDPLVPVRMEYYENEGVAVAQLNWSRISAVQPPDAPVANNWRGEYYDNISLNGIPVLVRNDARINFNWAGNAPAPALMGADRFSVRWTRTLDLSPGRYQLTTFTDDGVRLWVNGQLLIDQWQVQSATQYNATVDHPGGPLPVMMEYFENTGLAMASLSWTQIPADDLPDPTIPTGTMRGASYLNVRSGPGLEYEPFSSLTSGQTVPLVGRDQTAVWLNVVLPDNRRGWVSSRYMISNTPYANLPVVTP